MLKRGMYKFEYCKGLQYLFNKNCLKYEKESEACNGSFYNQKLGMVRLSNIKNSPSITIYSFKL